MKKFNSVVLVVLVILMFVIASCGIKPAADVPSSGQKTKNRVIVSITDPLDNEAYPISAGLSIRGEAISDAGIERMELWVDGELYETYYSPERGLNLLVHYWDWSPKLPGYHSLLVRAYDGEEQSGFSNIIHIKGIKDPGYILITKAEENDTLNHIAERYGIQQAVLAESNRHIVSDAILDYGTEVIVPIGGSPEIVYPTLAGKIFLRMDGWIKVAKSTIFKQQLVLKAPSLMIVGGECGATLHISDNAGSEAGFNVYRLDPGGVSFKKIITLPAIENNTALTFQDKNLYGSYQYYVEAFDSLTSTKSELGSLTVIDSECAGTQLKIDSLAFIPVSVEDYYLYISINNAAWRRFPANEFTYLKRSDNLDFNQIISTLTPGLIGKITFKGEVWGMINDTASLLGTFDKSFDPQPAPAILNPASIGLNLTTKMEVRGVMDVSSAKYPWYIEKGIGFQQEVFRFGTDTDAEYGIWQVTSAPMGSDVSFNPACLLLTGKANGVGNPSDPFEFGIDFSPLKPEIEKFTIPSFENSVQETLIIFSPVSPEKLDYSSQQVVNQPQYDKGSFAFPGEPILTKLDPCSMNESPEGKITFYARIIPMKNEQAVGKPSNTVILEYDPQGQLKIKIPVIPLPTEPYYDLKIINFTGVHVPVGKYQYCVQIVENNNSIYPHKPGTVICPETFKGGNQDSLLDAIESAFNFFTDIYNKLSDWVTKLVEQLNPLCIGANLATSAINTGQDEVKDACHYIAVIAVTAAKTYAGLPPTLPNFDQLTDLGKENLVDLAAQELESYGVPCPEDCKNVIRKGIDAGMEQVKNNMSNSSCVGEVEAHENGVEPLCVPPGVVTKPDPRGQPAPAVVEVQVTRRNGSTGTSFPDPTSCSVYVNVFAKNDSHIGESYGTSAGFNWQGVAIEGNLMSGISPLANLAPGQSTKIPMIMSPIPYWLDGHQKFVKSGWKPEHYDDWGILYDGAMAKITASGFCSFDLPEGKGETNKSFAGDNLGVGPLGNAWNQTCFPYCP